MVSQVRAGWTVALASRIPVKMPEGGFRLADLAIRQPYVISC